MRSLMPTFAAIDIGSNSCRLKIATVHMHRLKMLHEDRVGCVMRFTPDIRR